MESLNSNNKIRLSKSCIGEAEKAAVMAVLDQERLGMGAQVAQFENALTDFFERPTLCVVNGTAALHLALQACGIGRGHEVLVPSLTYVASFQAISATGAVPVACDIDQSTLTLSWRDAEKRITSRTKAIMPVHYAGGVGDLENIYRIACQNGLRVVEDAAHAFGSRYNEKKVGGFGDIACFSFDGIKNITSGEGGCIVTADPEILQRIRDARLLGVAKDTHRRYSGQRSWEFDVESQGWRYHMSNIMAAIGIEQLGRFDELAAKRTHLARCYDKEFSTIDKVNYISQNYDEIVPHIYPIILAGDKNRAQLRQRLEEVGVETGIHYFPNHKHSFYKGDTNYLDLLTTDDIYPRILTLPLHPDLTESDIKFVAQIIARELPKCSIQKA